LPYVLKREYDIFCLKRGVPKTIGEKIESSAWDASFKGNAVAKRFEGGVVVVFLLFGP
jgi:hypothetical protein